MYAIRSYYALESALSQHYGRTVQIRLAHEQELAAETPAQRQAREAQERQQRAVDSYNFV